MERRPRPNYDRVTFRRAIRGFAVSFLSIAMGGVLKLSGAWADWIMWPMTAGMFAGFLLIGRIPINRCNCPTCGEPLKRPPETTEFPCERCGILWVTQSWGFNAFE
jgi:hypothetical protein